MDANSVEQVFVETSAFLKGHFELSSGLHSDAYCQCALVLQYPHIAEKLAVELAKSFENDEVTCVVGPALGGVTLAYEVARALKVRGIFAERKDGVMLLRRGFSLGDNEKVLVVEDVITTGGSVKEVLALLEGMNVEIVGVASLVDRSGSEDDIFKYPFKSLLKLPIKAYTKEECPLCQSGSEVVKPGSKKKK